MTRPPAAVSSDHRQFITRTWRGIAVRTAALFAVAVVGLDALAVGVVLDIARGDATRQLSRAMDDPDALTHPPLDILVYTWDGQRLRSSPGAPAGPLDPQALADQSGEDRTIDREGRRYLVRTYRADGLTVQLALDLAAQRRERDRLFAGLAAAGSVGVLLAGGFGALIARRAIAPLGEALSRQQRFVADASHELRTPLTQLHTRAQLIERELRAGGDPARLLDDVQQLVRGSRQMGDLVGELLLAAQLRVAPDRFGAVDLRALTNQAVEAERPRARQRGVEITIAAGGPDPCVARGIESALRRVLASLVDNALCHTPAGGLISIELRADTDRSVEVLVRDTGSGFGQSDSGRLFERFYRGEHGDGRRFGLGLSLVRDVVDAHSGSVRASAEPDGGACFTVRLPAWPG